jgi:hypothetical protein
VTFSQSSKDQPAFELADDHLQLLLLEDQGRQIAAVTLQGVFLPLQLVFGQLHGGHVQSAAAA